MSTPIKPFAAPPPAAAGGLQKSPRMQSLSDISNIPVYVDPQTPSPPAKMKTVAQTEGREALANIRCPTVVLDAPHVTSIMAATLGMSLLGHILFLKSQVPFPVVQLARMPVGASDSKAAKRRAELLGAYDTLSSHLQTTFSALSAAYAHKKTKSAETRGAHMMFVVGPSIGAPKARVIFVVDGLEVKLWGARQGGARGGSGDENACMGRLDEKASGVESEKLEENESDSGSDGSDDDSDKESDSEEESDSDSAPEPPASRSPSPSPPTSDEFSPATPLPARPMPKPRPFLAELPATPLAQHARSPHSTPTSGPTFAEEQQTLKAAERLLSRTLANACAEESGGMSAELAPSQTHILLRAPRRFSHPAWVPRQNIVRATDAALEAFLEETVVPDGAQAKVRAKGLRGVKTEGVWLGCRASAGASKLQHGEDGEEDEEDDMIWWAWDGKIQGFADW